METSEREIFENVHGKCKNKMDIVKCELDKRKSAHKDLLQRLKLEKETGSLEEKFDVFSNQKSNAKYILEKYKKYMIK